MKRQTALASLALPFVPLPVLAQNKTPRKIGLTTALTGPFASVAAEYTVGYKLGVEQVNAAGGINGRAVELLIEDSKGVPADGIAAMRKLVQIDNVEGIITLFTGVSTAQMTLADQLKIPAVAGIETPGIVDNSQYMFACGLRQDKTVPLVIDYWKKHNVKKVYAFFPAGATGNALGPALQKLAAPIGTEVTLALIALGDNDYRGQAARVKAENPDALYMQTGGAGTTDALVIRQIREIGVTAPMYYGSNFYTSHNWREAVGPYSEGNYFAGANLDRTGDYGRKFIREFRAKTGFEPGYSAAELYDGGRLLMYAMRNANTADEIRAAMANLKGMPSALGGTLTMGPDHYVNYPVTGLWQVRKGVEVKVD
jgi:branched-chain amino acid transport system substrate-binding protein